MSVLKGYRVKRFVFFWTSIAAYFLPFIIVTASLLPLMKAGTGQKFAIGMAVLLVNALPFIGGIFRGILAHFPFINVLSVAFIALAFFFTAEVFQNYVYTFFFIELSAALGSVVACVLWSAHLKYKRKSEQGKTFIEMSEGEKA